MAMYEEDPDVVRWGLNFLTGYYPGYFPADHHQPSSVCETNYTPSVTGYHCNPHCSVADVQVSTAPEFSRNWSCGTANNNYYRDVGIMESSSGYYSSSPDQGYGGGGGGGEEEEAWDLQITDEDFASYDGEVGKRLNQMVPVAHVPRINGEIPSTDEATSDHQRLIDRLHLYDLIELKVKGDGNCQFRALSDQIYRTSEHHTFVREQILKQLKAYPEIYEGYVPMTYSEYLEKLSRDGEWGDHVTLQAAADSYGLKIFVITSFKDTCYIEILPKVEKSKRVICLSFWAEVHYNSIYPEGELPSPEAKKKKNWWKF